MALWAFLQVAVQHQSIRNLSTKWIANQGNFQIYIFSGLDLDPFNYEGSLWPFIQSKIICRSEMFMYYPKEKNFFGFWFFAFFCRLESLSTLGHWIMHQLRLIMAFFQSKVIHHSAMFNVLKRKLFLFFGFWIFPPFMPSWKLCPLWALYVLFRWPNKS